MRKFLLCTMAVLAVFSFAASSDATNGDNLIAIGPISRSMGGVGIALPQDPWDNFLLLPVNTLI